jgi:hypothetical protein
MLRSDSSGWNCLGRLRREIGHKRVPMPPAMMMT